MEEKKLSLAKVPESLPPVVEAPILPPSKDITRRNPRWYERQGQALWYMWGRMDAGESHRDVNDNYRFSEAWADAYFEFEGHRRSSMPSLQGALAKFDAGEDV